MNDRVDLRPLKQRALKIGGAFRDIVAAQPDTMDRNIYLTKVGDWLRLLEIKETVE